MPERYGRIWRFTRRVTGNRGFSRAHAACVGAQETRLAGAGWQGLYDALQRSLAPQRAWASQVAASAAASAAPASRGAPASGAAHRRSPPRRPGATDGGTPAWSVLLGGELPMEGLVRQTLTLVGASAAFARRRDADARTHGGSDVETAWLVRHSRWRGCIAHVR